MGFITKKTLKRLSRPTKHNKLVGFSGRVGPAPKHHTTVRVRAKSSHGRSAVGVTGRSAPRKVKRRSVAGVSGRLAAPHLSRGVVAPSERTSLALSRIPRTTALTGFTGKLGPAPHHDSALSEFEHIAKQIATENPVTGTAIHGFNAAKAAIHGDWTKAAAEGLKGTFDATGGGLLLPEIKAEKAVSDKFLAPPLHSLAKSSSGPVAGITSGAARGVGLSPKTSKRIGQIAGNFVKDAVNLPAEVVPSAYLTLKHPGKVIKSFPKTDPVGRLIFHGDTRGLQQHPLNAALEVSGAAGAAGRGLGAATRTLDRVAGTHIGSTKRPDLKLYANAAGGPAVRRRYSKDLGRKAAQVGLEKAKRAKGRDPNIAAHNIVDYRGKRLAHQINKRVDTRVFVGEQVRRQHRGDVQHASARALPGASKARRVLRKGKAPTTAHMRPEAAPLVASRIIRGPDTVVHDLHAYRQQVVEALRQPASAPARQFQQENLHGIDALLKDKRFIQNPHPTIQAVQKLIDAENTRTQKQIELGVLPPDAANAKYVPYGVTHMGAKPSGQWERNSKGNRTAPYFLEDAKGNHITAEHVKAHMAANGVPEPAFFSQKPGFTSEKGQRMNAYPVQGKPTGRPAIRGKRRTGVASEQALSPMTDQNVLTQQAVRSQGVIDLAQNFDHMVRDMAVHKPLVKGGKVVGKRAWNNRLSAEHAASELSHHMGADLVPVLVGRAKKMHLQIDGATPEEHVINGVSELLQQAFTHTGQGQYVLLPKVAVERWLDHNIRRTHGEKAVQAVYKRFKEAVLTTSTKFVAGNWADAALRVGAHGITPADMVRGRTVVKGLEKINPDEAARAKALAGGGGLFTSHDAVATYRPPSKFAAIRGVSKAWNGWKTLWFGVARAPEKAAGYGALGKVARTETQRTLRSAHGFFKVGEKGLHDYIEGLQGSPAQVQAGDYIAQVIGGWGRLSPGAKRFLAQYAPFGQWLKVALKFVYVTLPVHHPVKVGILASLNSMTEQERAKLGLDLFAGKDSVRQWPNNQGGIPGGKGKIIPTQSFTSFGVMSQFPESITGTLGGPARNILNAAEGKSYFGQDVPGATDWGVRAQLLLNTLGQEFVPGYAIGQRIREGAGTTKGLSSPFGPHTKPGTSKGDLAAVLNQIFNPFHTNKTKVAGAAASKARQKKSKGGGGYSNTGGYSGGGYKNAGGYAKP